MIIFFKPTSYFLLLPIIFWWIILLREIGEELVEYIIHSTGVDRETVLKVLRAEEKFLVLQIEKSMEVKENDKY